MQSGVNQLMQAVIPDLFERSKSVARADSIEAMSRELPKLCSILELDPVTLKPLNPPTRILMKKELEVVN